MTELKLCPFCNGKPELISFMSGELLVAFVRCKVCDAQIDTQKTNNQAIKAWNTRKP